MAETPSYASYTPTANQYSAYATTSAQPQSSYESSYDPYKPLSGISKQAPPSQPAAQSHSSYPTFVDSYAVEPSIPSVQPPLRSAASAATYRPKTSNAYDPPLPPPKPKAKRPPAFQSPITSPAHIPYALGPGSPPATRVAGTPTLPPPPPRKASLPPPPRSSSAARPNAASPAPSFGSHASYALPTSPLPHSAVPPPPPAVSTRQYTSPPPPAPHQSPPRVEAPRYPPGSTWIASSPMGEPASSIHSDDKAAMSYWNHLEGQAADEGVHPAPVTASNGVPHYSSWDDYPNDDVGAELGVSPKATSHAEGGESFVDHEASGEDFEQEETADSLLHTEVNPTVADHEDPEAAMDATPSSLASAPSPSTGSVYDPYRPQLHSSPPSTSASHSASYAYSPEVPTATSWASPERRSVEYSHPSTSPPKPILQTRSSIDSYRPSAGQTYEPVVTRRTASPGSFSVRSTQSTHSREGSIRDPYAPPDPSTSSSSFGARYRSTSNGSAFSLNAAAEDPYAPVHHSRQQSMESLSRGGFSLPHAFSEESLGPAVSAAQVVTLAASTRPQYAPSPSLLGSNDPLGRTSVRVPVISFGFGGKLITCFHGSSTLHTGFDIAMSSRASTTLHMRSMQAVIPQSALDTSTATYPGPLFADPGTPTTTLVRTGVSAQVKAKKAKLVQYLNERADEISLGIGYLHQGSVEGYKAESKLVLIKLLRVMIENDGRLSGRSVRIYMKGFRPLNFT